MTAIHVQFADLTEQTIISYFAGPQDPDVWPNQGEIEDSDPRYLALLSPPAVEAVVDPVEKIKMFLLTNPDVAAVLK
jgi:hypothetical protein